VWSKSPSLAEELRAAQREPNRRLDRYLLLNELGRGGFGCVFRAWDPQLERMVALKVLTRPSSDQARRRFAREAKATATLRHPNIVPVHDAGTYKGLPYLVMELIEGRTLEHVAAGLADGPRGPDHTRLALLALRDTAQAVAHAHERGIVHRDLKPGNVIIDQGGQAYVLDFGLAHLRDAARLTQTGATLGTPLYMAPEQAKGARAAPSMDVYALGATLYHALTGKPPYDVDSFFALAQAQATGSPLPPSTLCPGLPARVDRLALACLAPDPADRPPSAAAVAAELEACLRAPAVAAPPPPHQRLLLVLLGLACVVLVALLTVLLFGRDGPSQLQRAGQRTEATAPGQPSQAAVNPQDRPPAAPPAAPGGAAPPAPTGSLPDQRLPSPSDDLARREARAWVERGDALMVEGRNPEALAAYDRALGLQPSHQTALANRAAVLRRLGRREEALATLDAMVRLRPRDPGSRYMRAVIHTELGDPAAAREDLERFLELAPDHPAAARARERLQGLPAR
jgi:serine/threonine-protein kinase